MDHIELLAESIIEFEDVKQEQEEPVWNSTELIEANAVKSDVNEEDENDDEDDVLEPPVAIFLNEVVEEDVECEVIEEEEEVCVLWENDLHIGPEGKGRNAETLGATSDPFTEKSVGSVSEHSVCTCTTGDKAANQVHTNAGGKPPERGPCKKCSAEKDLDVSEQNQISSVYECSECRESFTQREHLAAHMLNHSQGKSYNCPLCQMRFKFSQNLVLHMHVHTQEESYKCVDCGESCMGRRALALHMRRHRQRNPHICSLCSMSFRRRDYFDRHMRMHAKEKSQSRVKTKGSIS